MRQKRVQGSHFAHLKQASAANQFVIDRRVDPCLSEVFPWKDIPAAHEKMLANQHLGFGIKPLPAGGELCSLAATVKQPGTKQRFQRLDLFAQRRLGDTQPLRRQAIITLFSQHHKGA